MNEYGTCKHFDKLLTLWHKNIQKQAILIKYGIILWLQINSQQLCKGFVMLLNGFPCFGPAQCWHVRSITNTFPRRQTLHNWLRKAIEPNWWLSVRNAHVSNNRLGSILFQKYTHYVSLIRDIYNRWFSTRTSCQLM